jgi:hypothetical protein
MGRDKGSEGVFKPEILRGRQDSEFCHRAEPEFEPESTEFGVRKRS